MVHRAANLRGVRILMMKLTTFLKSLSGVRPRLAGKQIKAGEILPEPLLADLYEMYAVLGPVTLIGPDEGEALRDLYNAGSLPMESWGSIDRKSTRLNSSH